MVTQAKIAAYGTTVIATTHKQITSIKRKLKKSPSNCSIFGPLDPWLSIVNVPAKITIYACKHTVLNKRIFSMFLVNRLDVHLAEWSFKVWLLSSETRFVLNYHVTVLSSIPCVIVVVDICRSWACSPVSLLDESTSHPRWSGLHPPVSHRSWEGLLRQGYLLPAEHGCHPISGLRMR